MKNEAKKYFLKKKITENATNKDFFGNYANLFFTGKGFHYNQKFFLKTKTGVTSSERTIANIF